jgi:cell division protein ZapA
MPEVAISIGGRQLEVSCQEGEEQYLHSAAKMLDTEAQTLASQIGRIPEPRMLLMAGLMLADKTVAMEDKVNSVEQQLAEVQAELTALKNQPAPAPERVEVPVIPAGLSESLAEIAARTESLASAIEEKGQA